MMIWLVALYNVVMDKLKRGTVYHTALCQFEDGPVQVHDFRDGPWVVGPVVNEELYALFKKDQAEKAQQHQTNKTAEEVVLELNETLPSLIVEIETSAAFGDSQRFATALSHAADTLSQMAQWVLIAEKGEE